MDPIVQRIYDIKVQGYDQALKNLQALTKAFEKMDETKRRLDDNLQRAVETGNTAAVEKLTTMVSDLDKRLKELDKTRQKSAREVELLAKAEKLQADTIDKLAAAEKKEAEATLAAAKADQVRTETLIAKQKEEERLLNLEEKRRRAAERESASPVNNTVNTNFTGGSNGSAEGYLASLRRQLKELEKAYEDLRKDEDDYANKQRTLADAIRTTRSEINSLTSATKVKKTASDEENQSLRVQVGSYRDVMAQLKELRPFVQTNVAGSTNTFEFRGQTLGFDQAIQKFKELSAAEQAFRRQFAKDGTLVGEYTTGILQAFSKLGLDDFIKKQRADISTEMQRLRQESKDLAEQLSAAARAGVTGFEQLEQQLRENIQQQERMQASLESIDNAVRRHGSVHEQVSSTIRNGFRDVRTQITQTVGMYIGLQAVISKLTESVSGAKQISDQTTELGIQLNATTREAEELTASLQKIDTRTTVSGLQNIADVALKAGTAKENIEEVTRAVDIVKTAFGKDFGDIESGTETFAKLINIFYTDGEITGERILRIGNSIRTIANESVASVPFINDFAGRMAGLKQITAISLPDVIGLGAGFEALKVSAEVSSTALLKVIPKLATDVQKYAQLAKVPVEEFRELLNTNPAEALIRFSEGLAQSGENLEAISEAFADAELDGGRVVTVLGALGGKSEIFREQIRKAGTAINDTSAITDAFEKKNTNLAATLDKINKRFTDVGASRSFQLILLAISTTISFLLSNVGLLVGVLGLLAVQWAVQNSAMLILRAQVIGYNIAIGASYVGMGLLSIAQAAYNAILFITNGVLTLVTRGLQLFNIQLALTGAPLRIILTVLGLIGAAFAAFGRSLDNAKGKLGDYIIRQRAIREVQQQANAAIAEQISKLDSYVSVLRSASSSADTKRLAVQKLTEISTKFNDVLKDGVVNQQKLKAAYDETTNAIRLQAQVQAASGLSSEKQKDVLQVTTLRQRLETEFAQGSGVIRGIKGLTDSEVQLLNDIFDPGKSSVRAARNAVSFNESEFLKIKDALTQRESQMQAIYEQYLGVQTEVQSKLDSLEAKNKETERKNLESKDKLNATELQKLIDAIDAELKLVPEGDKKIVELREKRKGLQDRLDAILSFKQPKNYTGAKLSGEQKDALKDLDAIRDEELARLRQALLQRSEFQRREQDVIKMNADGEITIVREATRIKIETEEAYLTESLRIQQEAIDKKLSLLKGNNAEERKQVAQLKLERITIEQDTNNKIFENRKTVLKQQLDEEVKTLQEQARLAAEDQSLNPTEKATIKRDSDQQILTLQVRFQQEIDQLEKQFGVQSLKNARENAEQIRLMKIQLQKDERELLEADLKTSQQATEKSIEEFKRIIAAQRLSVAESDQPQRKKDLANQTLDKQETFGILAREVAGMQRDLPLYEKLLAAKQITDKEYEEFLTELFNKQRELHDANFNATQKDIERYGSLGDLLKAKLSGLFGFDDNSEEGKQNEKLLGQVIAESYNLAQMAMQSYFDAERAAVERSKQNTLDRIEKEKQQLLAQAQNSEEREEIEKRARAKREAAEREAGERLKRIKRSEAKIALATELANIAVAAAQNPLNGITLGAAGIAMYGLLAGMAFARYALNIKNIEAQQFAGGGKVMQKPILSRYTYQPSAPRLQAGRIDVPSNIRTQPNGDNVLATVKTGEVILNEQQQRALGGAETFRKIGVPGFAGGGVVRKNTLQENELEEKRTLAQKVFHFFTGGLVSRKLQREQVEEKAVRAKNAHTADSRSDEKKQERSVSSRLFHYLSGGLVANQSVNNQRAESMDSTVRSSDRENSTVSRSMTSYLVRKMEAENEPEKAEKGIPGFAAGGRIQPPTLPSGKINVTANIPALKNGDNVLAYVRTGEVILNQKQQAALGGPDIFRRLNIPGFATGGLVQPSFGSLSFGSNLQAPINTSAYLNNNSNSADMAEVKNMLMVQTQNLSETARQIHQRIDKIKVINNPLETTEAADKYKAAQQVGTV